jgi:hypothetical protein
MTMEYKSSWVLFSSVLKTGFWWGLRTDDMSEPFYRVLDLKVEPQLPHQEHGGVTFSGSGDGVTATRKT